MNSKKEIESLSDKDLVERIVQTNDTTLFAELYDRYIDTIYNKCYGFTNSKEEAQDLTHDLFLHLFAKLRTFKGSSKFSTWLYSLTYNYCVNYVTRHNYNKNKKEFKNDDIQDNSDGIDSSESELMGFKIENLRISMEQIDPHDKIILFMKYQDNFSIKEIMNVLEINESAVKMRLKRARNRVINVYKNLS